MDHFYPEISFTPGHRQWMDLTRIGRRLFVGDDFAYVTDLMGFNRIDLADPKFQSSGKHSKTAFYGDGANSFITVLA